MGEGSRYHVISLEGVNARLFGKGVSVGPVIAKVEFESPIHRLGRFLVVKLDDGLGSIYGFDSEPAVVIGKLIELLILWRLGGACIPLNGGIVLQVKGVAGLSISVTSLYPRSLIALNTLIRLFKKLSKAS